jgi:hypothetical protein
MARKLRSKTKQIIYHFVRQDQHDYDEYDAHVVSARTIGQACDLLKNGIFLEGWKKWTVVEIGIAVYPASDSARVILSSFNAG